MREPRRPALLVTRQGLLEYLSNQKLALFWTALGEKMIIGEPGANQVPQIEFSCSYRLGSKGEVMASKPITKVSPPSGNG